MKRGRADNGRRSLRGDHESGPAKATGQAKGLGLSISNQIVRDFGGRIDVESREHQGATFKVILPRAAP